MAIWVFTAKFFQLSLRLTIFIIKCGRENPDAGIFMLKLIKSVSFLS